jgi:hypothetical protein
MPSAVHYTLMCIIYIYVYRRINPINWCFPPSAKLSGGRDLVECDVITSLVSSRLLEYIKAHRPVIIRTPPSIESNGVWPSPFLLFGQQFCWRMSHVYIRPVSWRRSSFCFRLPGNIAVHGHPYRFWALEFVHLVNSHDDYWVGEWERRSEQYYKRRLCWVLYLVRGYKIDGLNNFLFPHARALCIIRLISAELFPLYIHGAQSCVLHLCNWGFHRRRRISLELFQRSNQASKLAPPVLFMGSNQLADRGNFPLI